MHVRMYRERKRSSYIEFCFLALWWVGRRCGVHACACSGMLMLCGGVRQPCQMLWSVDAQPEQKATMAQEIAARWVPCLLSQMLPAAPYATAAKDPALYRRPDRAGGAAAHGGSGDGVGVCTAEGMRDSTPLGAEGGVAGDRGVPKQSKYILSRHDVGKWVTIYQCLKKKDAGCKGERDGTARGRETSETCTCKYHVGMKEDAWSLVQACRVGRLRVRRRMPRLCSLHM